MADGHCRHHRLVRRPVSALCQTASNQATTSSPKPAGTTRTVPHRFYDIAETAYRNSDRPSALKYFRQAAGQGAAPNALAKLHFEGKGLPRDDGQACKWLEKAAVQRLAEVQYNLGSLYYYGLGTPKDLGLK